MAGTIAFAYAIPVEPSVQRTLTDQFERTTEAMIVDVSADAIEIVRTADQARFSIALNHLSKADQEFAAKLLANIQLSEPLPDTAWLQAIRSDFQMYDAPKKQFIPLSTDVYARDRILVVAFTHIYDPDKVFDSRIGRVLPNGEHVSIPPKDVAPVLWILDGGKLADFHTVAQKLPEGHAMISFIVRERIEKRGHPLWGEAVSKWIKQNPAIPGQTSRSITLSDDERDALTAKLSKVVPVYWFEPSACIFAGMKNPPQMPLFGAFYRDGTPVKYNGIPVRGPRHEVMSVLRGHASQLE